MQHFRKKILRFLATSIRTAETSSLFSSHFFFELPFSSAIASLPTVPAMSITDQQDNSSNTVVYDVYSAYQYPWMCLNFFFGYWLVSSICRRVIQSLKILEIGSKFNELEEEKKRNVITYVMELFVTTIAFFLQVIGGVDILFRNEDTTSPEKMDLMVLAMLFIIVLYIWELCYRQTIGWPLLVHHLVSIFCIQTLTATFIQTQEVIYVRLLILAGF